MIFCLQEEFEFRLTPKTKTFGEDITETKCLGRWLAEGHVAYEGFIEDEFILTNFVLFNENQFAVMFLGQNITKIYTRLEMEEIGNLVGDDEVPINNGTSAGDDAGAMARAEEGQQVCSY